MTMRVWKRGTAGISPDAKYVGRPSAWGNPYVIGKDGTREEVLAKFETYARERLISYPDWLKPLVGHDLVCHCVPLACHADILIKLIKELYSD